MKLLLHSSSCKITVWTQFIAVLPRTKFSKTSGIHFFPPLDVVNLKLKPKIAPKKKKKKIGSSRGIFAFLNM